jgi:hypothetical protein
MGSSAYINDCAVLTFVVAVVVVAVADTQGWEGP